MAGALLVGVVQVSGVTASAAAPAKWTGTGLQASDSQSAVKSASGRIAQSDPALLARRDSAMVSVDIKLDFDATASYKGDVKGLAATSPQVTGRKLTGNSAEESAYDRYTSNIIDKAKAAIVAKVPTAKIGQSFQLAYGGIALRLPANQAKTLLSIPGVAAVQTDTLQHPLTDSSTTFIGAPTIWSQEGGQSLAGKGVIFADLDTGIWPEHPSLADNPALGNPPPAPSGLARPCNFGDNPLTVAIDVFQCNHKVIGGAPFIDTYNAVVGGEVYPASARDSDGHGTHTTTTAAGDVVASAKIFGFERGPASGVAPGAYVLEYKVCGAGGCFNSDSVAAVEQSILDGADVINYSISGGANPYSDAVELAFLDAYAAGIFVAASAGNSGPGAGTTDHQSAWVTTVGASTQSRAFQSTLTVTDGAASATFVGSSLTAGVSSATPIVMASSIAGYDALCSTVPPAAAVAGKIVACLRGVIGRVQKGKNLADAGAAGMILYNIPLADTETDNHFLPAIHLADGTAFVAFMTAHPAAMGSFTDGVKAVGQGDVMAAFSSRGPGGQFIKPDITAPGVQILAGNTPTPDAVAAGPAGEYYQAIAGTSMSSPHIAGSALLLAALHSNWGPGDIKSAIMTTATKAVVKEDLVTPADPFDYGAGRVDLTKAGAVGLTFADTATNFYNGGVQPTLASAMQLNLPSINAPTMPGTVTVTRTARNTTNHDIQFTASTIAPAGSTIRVSPTQGTIRAGHTGTFRVTITSNAPPAQYFGEVDITPNSGSALHLPVAFYNQQGDVNLTSTCSPASIREHGTTTCTVTAQNNSFADASVSVSTSTNDMLRITGATGATLSHGRVSAGPATLAGQKDAIPAISAGETPAGGYLPLGLFGVAPSAIGDEEITNFNVSPFVFAGRTYTSLGVVSDGYIVAGGGTSTDVNYLAQAFPDPTRPNGVLSPYWADLDGTGAPGISVGQLTDGVSSWIVVQWDVHLYGDTSPAGMRSFQVWIGINGAEDISYAYDTNALGQGAGAAGPINVGAENASGTGGANIGGAAFGVPASDYVITSTPGAPGGSLTYSLTARGSDSGQGVVTSTMIASLVPGKTIVKTPVSVGH